MANIYIKGLRLIHVPRPFRSKPILRQSEQLQLVADSQRISLLFSFQELSIRSLVCLLGCDECRQGKPKMNR